jgi:hypothetical protein
MRAPVVLRFLVLGLASFLTLTPPHMTAADGDADNAAELQRKAQEVEKLKEELNRAQSDLQKLEAENQRLRAEKTNPPPTPATPPATPATPARPAPAVATLRPLAPGEVVETRDMVEQFRADPAGAEQRYRKKAFRVRGEIARFSVKFAVRYYDVVLASPERSISVVCGFNYVDRYRSVYTKQTGEVLVGVVGQRKEIPLLKVGDSVVVEGTCKGLKDGELVFNGCQVVK